MRTCPLRFTSPNAPQLADLLGSVTLAILAGQNRCAHVTALRADAAMRQQTIEPVFGIIKETMGFRRFRLRGLTKLRSAWTLVTLACRLKRLLHLGASLAAA